MGFRNRLIAVPSASDGPCCCALLFTQVRAEGWRADGSTLAHHTRPHAPQPESLAQRTRPHAPLPEVYSTTAGGHGGSTFVAYC